MKRVASPVHPSPRTDLETSDRQFSEAPHAEGGSASGMIASTRREPEWREHWKRLRWDVAVLQTPWARYGSSFLVSVVALGLTYLLDSHLSQTPTPLLFAAVTLAAWYGGLGPAVLSTLVCALGLDIFLEDPSGVPGAGGSSFLHLGVFVLVAILVSTLNERMRHAEAQARADATRLAVLSDTSRALTAVISDHVVTLETVARQIGAALGDACVISLLSEDGQWLNQAAWHHRDPVAKALMGELYAGQRHAADEGLSGRALQQMAPVLINTDRPDDFQTITKPAYAPLLERFPIYSLLCLPLCARGRSIGTLTLWRGAPRRPFTPSDRELVQELADRSAMAIDNARLSAYYQALFKEIPEPAVVLDSEHRLLDANPSAAQLLGYSVEDLRMSPVDVLVEGDTDALAGINDGLREHGRWHGERELRRSDGESVPVEFRAVAVQLLSGPVYICVWHDLTEQRSLQEMRSGFVASASHELRTPLTAALAAIGLMQQPGSGDLDPAHRELANNAMRNIQRLRILVDDLLVEGQLQAEALSLSCKPLDLRSVIAGAVESMHSLLERKGQSIELDVPEPLPVNGDAHRLEQVFVNLLANANQHTPKGTRIHIIGRLSDLKVRVSVCDDGPGIPLERLDTIFERYSRADSPSSGTGLGLTIAHDLIELHGGRIWAENGSDSGAAFHMALPCPPDGGH